MSYKIYTFDFFNKQLKRLVKKYPSLKNEFSDFVNALSEHPKTGTAIGKGCYKVRLSIASKGKGSSGGARIITHVQVTKSSVYLLSIYDKSEQKNISQAELAELLKQIQ